MDADAVDPVVATSALPSRKPRARYTARRGDHAQFVARLAKRDTPNISEDDDASTRPRKRQTARRGDHAGFLARLAHRNAKSDGNSSLASPEGEEVSHSRRQQTARRGNHAGFLARMTRMNEQREGACESPSKASEAEPSTGEEEKAHMDEETWTEEDDSYQEEESSSSSSPSSSSEEEDHDPPHPRAKQTARRGDHLGFPARMARRSSNTNEHSSTPEAGVESRPGPRTQQTARRGDHAGFLARMALRNGQIIQPSGSSNESPGRSSRMGKQTARRGGLTASDSKRSIQDRVSGAIEETEWDITGDWEIKCDTLANWDGDGPRKLSLAIYHDQARPGSHMALFDFHISKGIMRITCLTPRTTGKKVRGTYIYRGRETGEGEILIGSDSRIYKIVFKNKGTRLKGKYAGAGSERVTFTGSKVKRGLQRRASSTDEWESFSEEEWARASVGRWGGWVG